MKKKNTRKLRLKKLGFVRGGLSLLIGLLVFYYGSNVKAGMNDSVIAKKQIDGIYAVVTIDGVDRIFYLNIYEMNDKIFYCLDLGGDISNSVYHSINDSSVSHLNEEQIEYISSISYFGYGYEGHDDYCYYMAAQELIWEYLGNIDVVWTKELVAEGEMINIDSYKANILELKDKYDQMLEFNFEDGQAVRVGDEIILNDNNNVLSNYEVVSSKYSDVFIDGDKLIIKVGNVIGEEQIELKKVGYYEHDSSFYYYDNSQRLISNGNYKGIDKIIKFDIKGVSLRGLVVDSSMGINKPRGQAVLNGSVYELYDESDNLIGTYESDINGKFIVNNLLLGEYYIQQIEASEGYLVSKKKVWVEVNANNLEVKLRQQVISNNFQITKVYGSDGNYKPERKVMFDIYDANGRHYSYLTTNSKGVSNFNLEYGRYRIHQLTTTSGYSKVDDFYVDIKEHSTDVIYYNLIDELIKIKVRVVTLDSETGEKLNSNGFSYRLRKNGEDDYLVFDEKSIFNVDDNGDLYIPGFLGYGDYVLEQVEVPEGVVLNNDIYEFSINENSNLSLYENNFVMEVNVYNDLVMGQVEVIANEEKYYKDVNKFGYEIVPRSNSKFILNAKDDIIINGNVRYKAGQEVYDGLTDADGRLIINNLYLGSYCLVDSETVEEKCFTLDNKDDELLVVKENLVFTKFLEKGDITIQNISNNGEVISSAIFELLDKDGVLIYTGITNDEGIIKIDDVLVDEYCIRQKKVSSTYQVLDDNKCFFLEEDKTVEILNNLIVRDTISVPSTLLESIGFYESMVILFFMGTGIFVYKKVFSSNL